MPQDVWLINGETFDVQVGLVHASDRGLAYGDGLFETMRAIDGHIPLFDLHVQRLSEGCKRLSIQLDIETCIEQIGKSLKTEVDDHKQKIIKVIVSRGGGAEGYACDSSVAANIYIRVRTLLAGKKIIREKTTETPLRAKKSIESQIKRAQVCKTRLAIQPVLAGIKHLNRLEQVLAAAELTPKFDEGILLNTDDKVIEAVSSNLIAVIDGELWFPDLTQSGVRGVMQTWLQDMATQYSIPYKIAVFNLDQLLKASEILLTNSVRGVRNLSSIVTNTAQDSSLTNQESVDQNWQASSTELGTRMRSLIERELHQDFFSF